MSSKGRTQLKINLSRAKNDKEAASDVRFCVFSQKKQQKCKKTKLIFSTNFSEIFRTRPNASERIQMHPNASECIRAHPNRSEQVREPRKTCENVEKLAKKSRNFRGNFRDRLFLSVIFSDTALDRIGMVTEIRYPLAFTAFLPLILSS